MRTRPLAFTTTLALATLAGLAAPSRARADEGMWPLNLIPRDAVQKSLGVKLDDAWLDHVRLASVRFNNGGSGSFVGPSGLVLTNHHVGADCIAKVATSEHDYHADGYLAGKDGPEIKCPDLELNVTIAIEDVTARVRAAVPAGASDSDANTAMKAEQSRIEKACTEKTGSRCDVVTLYAGGRYDLYTYKKYTDVRLAFAPEFAIASFGGDPDNFTFPRHDLDMAVFRIYEAGKAVAPKEYLRWNAAGPKDGESVFISGHPGSTGRMLTVSQLEVLRDVVYPYMLDAFTRERAALAAYGKESKESERQIQKTFWSVGNSVKAIGGFERGLKDPALMKKKVDDEAAMNKAILADPKLTAAYGDVFDKTAKVQKEYARIFKRYAVLEARFPAGSLLGVARHLVRLAGEASVPNDKRLKEYRDSNLDSLKLGLLSPAPRYGGIELVQVREWLERLARDLGPNDPLVKKVLAGRTPDVAAREALALSRLSDVGARRQLLDGGRAAIDESSDPLVVLCRQLDPDARQIRKQYEDDVEAPLILLGRKVAEAQFAVKGTSVAPDATFTLRLSPGKVVGYTENGKPVPWATTFADLYAHATGKDPLKLPSRWLDAKGKLKPTTPYNFVSTNDIIGGNSGSPVVNGAGEIVGLVFDGNLSSLPNRFVYGDTTQRAVSVDTAAMSEALRTVYGAEALARELETR
jgi:Peptidase S46